MAVASAVVPEPVGSKQAEQIEQELEQERAVGLASAVLLRRAVGVAARVAELGVAATAVQQGREQQPGAWGQQGQQTPGREQQRGNQQQQAHQLVH